MEFFKAYFKTKLNCCMIATMKEQQLFKSCKNSKNPFVCFQKYKKIAEIVSKNNTGTVAIR